MSSTLMALVHGALLQQQQAKQANHAVSKKDCFTPPSPSGFVKHTSSDVTTLVCQAAAAQRRGSAASIPALLKELVDIVAETARIDGLLKEAQEIAPQCAEAQKWHEVSCHALQWSRNALNARQLKTLALMKELVQENNARDPVVHTEPVPTLAPKPSWLSLDAPEFCPAPKQLEAELYLGQNEALKRGLKGAEHVGSLKEDLEKLRCYDRECCILVRKLKPLGVQSPERLREHFSSYGELAEVLVSHNFEKPSPKRANGRVRPGALGFLVFTGQDAAKAVLAAGEEHIVRHGADAVAVAVERYDRSSARVEAEP